MADKYAKTKRRAARRAGVEPRATKEQINAEAKRIEDAAPQAKRLSEVRELIQQTYANSRGPDLSDIDLDMWRDAVDKRKK